MTEKRRSSFSIIPSSFITAALAAMIALHFGSPLFADDESYLAPGHPDGIALLPPPPTPGSAEYTADLATVRAAFNARTPEEDKRAEAEEQRLGIYNFTPVIGPFFTAENFPKTAVLLRKAVSEAAQAVKPPKKFYQRKRPCQVDKSLNIGPAEEGFSYPSGHSTEGTVYALILADIFPDKKDAILEEGRQIGWDRVLLAKHFPTDIQAGRVLGQAVFHELEKSPAFQQDLATAKAEVQAAHPESTLQAH